MNHLLRFAAAAACCALLPAAVRAQSVGIGTVTPNPSASLHLRAPNLGLLINQVSLSSLSDGTAVASPAFGLLVFNANAALPGGVGFYYNAGTAAVPNWTRLNTGAAGGDNLGNGVAQTDVNLNGNKLLGGTAATPSPDGLSVGSTGRVGIGLGALAATERLHVDGGGVRIGTLAWSTAADDRLLRFGDGSFVTIGETGGDDLLQFRAKDFSFNGSQGVSSGDVGIGLGVAVAPTQRLEVGGNIKITGPPATTGLVFADGTIQLTAATGGGGGFSLPYSGSGNAAAALFALTNTSADPNSSTVLASSNSGYGVRGLSTNGVGVIGSTNVADDSKAGVVGRNNNAVSDQAVGVLGISTAGIGVLGKATSGTGLGGLSTSFYGVSGQSSSGIGTFGGSGTSAGVRGESNSGTGVEGESNSGTGVRGVGNSSAFLNAGVIGDNTNAAGTGVLGRTETGQGVRGLAFGATGRGVYGDASGLNGAGVEGQASATGGTAVRAVATGGARALSAQANTSGAAALITQNGAGPALLVTGGSGVGLGTLTPLTRLSITPAATEAKITLYDGGSATAHYGFGVSGFQLNYHVPGASDNHVFYAGGKNGDGTELLRVQGNGRVGIGTNNPQDLLDVDGAARAVEVHTPTTGAANLLPVAYGRIRANATVAAGTGNFTCSQTNGLYTVQFTPASGLNATNFASAVILATPNGSTDAIFGFQGGAGQVQFIFGGGGVLDEFSFMVYRP